MGDNYFFDLIREEGEAIGLAKGKEEGRQEGLEEGRKREARTAILRILARRFGTPDPAVAERVEAIDDLSRLEDLVIQAAVCEDAKAFADALETG